ncbi:MAG: SRPBCC family protein [Solirubrobacteraceae bacterium]
MHVEETFVVERPPDAVFDYVTNPDKLSSWQTTKRSVVQLTNGPPGLGSRFRERTKPPLAKEFEQVTEFTEFERPRRLHVHVLEGPYRVDGTWTFEPYGEGTRVHFIAEGELSGLMKLFEPVTSRVFARQFAGYHQHLRRHLESEFG